MGIYSSSESLVADSSQCECSDAMSKCSAGARSNSSGLSGHETGSG